MQKSLCRIRFWAADQGSAFLEVAVVASITVICVIVPLVTYVIPNFTGDSIDRTAVEVLESMTTRTYYLSGITYDGLLNQAGNVVGDLGEINRVMLGRADGEGTWCSALVSVDGAGGYLVRVEEGGCGTQEFENNDVEATAIATAPDAEMTFMIAAKNIDTGRFTMLQVGILPSDL